MARRGEIPSLHDLDNARGLTDADRIALYSTAAWDVAHGFLEESPEKPVLERTHWHKRGKTILIYRPASRFDPVEVRESGDEHREWSIHPSQILSRYVSYRKPDPDWTELLDTSPHSFAMELTWTHPYTSPEPGVPTLGDVVVAMAAVRRASAATNAGAEVRRFAHPKRF